MDTGSIGLSRVFGNRIAIEAWSAKDISVQPQNCLGLLAKDAGLIGLSSALGNKAAIETWSAKNISAPPQHRLALLAMDAGSIDWIV